DGGYMDNLPVGIMKSMGADTIIAVDVASHDDTSPVYYGDSLSGWWVLLNKFNPFSNQKIPSIADIQSRLAYVSSVKTLEEAKNTPGCLYMEMPVQQYGTLEFSKFVGEYVHIYNEYDNEKPHIVHIYKLWENNKGLKGLYGCYYYRAEQTKHNLWQKFYDNEVFKTNTFQDHLIHDVLGKCCVINVNDFKTGYPKGFEGKSIYVCESRYNEISKTFNKIKNWSSLTPNDSRAPAIRFEIREIPIVLNKIESPLAAEFKAKRVKKEDSSTSEDIFSPDTNYDSQSDVPTTHSENKITESNNVPLSSARIRITSKKLSGRYKSNSSNLTIPSHHQTKSIPTNIHHNNGMVPSSYGYPNSTHIQQNPSQSHYVMSPFPSSQYYQNQQPHHYHPIGQQFTNQNITTSYTNSFAPLSSSSLQHSQNAMQVPSNVHSKVTNAKSDEISINNGVNINISSSQATNGQEILKSFQEPKHSEKYIKHREEIIARN
ncbi:8605_t:CDS:2, partial [Entrophospora sp. SA101]